MLFINQIFTLALTTIFVILTRVFVQFGLMVLFECIMNLGKLINGKCYNFYFTSDSHYVQRSRAMRTILKGRYVEDSC